MACAFSCFFTKLSAATLDYEFTESNVNISLNQGSGYILAGFYGHTQIYQVPSFDTSQGTLLAANVTISYSLASGSVEILPTVSPYDLSVQFNTGSFNGFSVNAGSQYFIPTGSLPAYSESDLDATYPDATTFGNLTGSLAFSPALSVVTSSNPWTLAFASSFNASTAQDTFVIDQQYTYDITTSVSYVFTPVPEPSSLVLVILSVLSMTVFYRRRRS